MRRRIDHNLQHNLQLVAYHLETTEITKVQE